MPGYGILQLFPSVLHVSVFDQLRDTARKFFGPIWAKYVTADWSPATCPQELCHWQGVHFQLSKSPDQTPALTPLLHSLSPPNQGQETDTESRNDSSVFGEYGQSSGSKQPVKDLKSEPGIYPLLPAHLFLLIADEFWLLVLASSRISRDSPALQAAHSEVELSRLRAQALPLSSKLLLHAQTKAEARSSTPAPQAVPGETLTIAGGPVPGQVAWSPLRSQWSSVFPIGKLLSRLICPPAAINCGLQQQQITSRQPGRCALAE